MITASQAIASHIADHYPHAFRTIYPDLEHKLEVHDDDGDGFILVSIEVVGRGEIEVQLHPDRVVMVCFDAGPPWTPLVGNYEEPDIIDRLCLATIEQVQKMRSKQEMLKMCGMHRNDL